jgi:hypothetical protein
MALALESRAQGVLFDKKTEGRKPPDTVPITLSQESVKYLKGQCHEIFDPRFFSSNNPH